MRKMLIYIGVTVCTLAVLLLGMKFVWVAKSQKPYSIYILDKTVTQADRHEHKSLTWILNQNKYVLPHGKHYSHKKDYFGFFPIDLTNGIFDFKSIRINEITDYALHFDMIFYADCFGVHAPEWSKQRVKSERSYQRIYGGLNQNDFLLLKEYLSLNKPAVLEYNLFSSPTNALVRAKTEDLLNISWTGWSACYFASFDTNSPNGPPVWIKNLYESQHHGAWPEDETGIVLIRNDELIELLTLGKELDSAIPLIKSTPDAMERFGIPESIKFEQWFEFIDPLSNRVHSEFLLDVTPQGKEILSKHGLDERIPAIVEGSELNFFYLTGNFSDNPTKMWTSKLYGGKTLNLFLSRFQNVNKAKFFYRFYTPLVESIINEQLKKEDD